MPKEAPPSSSYRGRFRLLEEIGEGGFARVFRARERTTGRRVALKILKDAYLRDKEITERFRREAFAVASISSPHVVGLHDFGISGDEIYLAMEFVEGPTLRHLIYERSWSAPEVHVIIGQIAQALSAAHRVGIVHRDLKPENVMLVAGEGGSRHVKVLDFGLAKLAELERKLELEPLTRVGMCFGTPQYMAPELIQSRPFDKTADLFALGVILFEMLGGVLPWDGPDAAAVMLAVVKRPAPTLQNLHPSIQRVNEVNRFLQRALAKDKSKRPSDAAAFFREFETALFADRPPPKRAAPVPAHDVVFASVWSASLDLNREAADATDVDAGSRFGQSETTLRGDALQKRRRLASGWMKSLAQMEGLPPTETDLAQQAVPTASPKPLGRSFQHAGPDEATVLTPEETDNLMLPQALAERRAFLVWVIPLLLALVLFAAALGYFIGRQTR